MSAEQRQFDRVRLPMPFRYQVSDIVSNSWREGRLDDLSTGGFRLTTREALDPGSRLRFQLPFPLRGQLYGSPLEFSGEIVWCRGAGMVEYGVKFLRMSIGQQQELDEMVDFFRESSPGCLTANQRV